MCTITLQYDQRSALARRKMAALLASGLFTQITLPVAREEAQDEAKEVITPALRRRINRARKEYAEGQTIKCRNVQEMQQFFDSL
jgi:hypothetical protein